MAQAAKEMDATPQRILEDIWSARNAQALLASTELDVFTHIAGGKTTAKEIARATKASERGIVMLLDALVGLGYLNKQANRYGLEPVSERFLVSSGDTYLGPLVYETKLVWESWGHLTDVVKSGRPFRTVDLEETGRDFFPQLVAAIFPMSYGAARGAVAAIPEKIRGRIKRILDVAAGAAPWSIAFAQAIPDAQVTVVDFPEVTKVAKKFTVRFGVADRYDYAEGNLRDVDFGRNKYDLVILGHIIHSEGEKWGKKLIKRSYRSLNEGGMLLIGEMIPNDDRSGPALPLVFGLNMLLNTAHGNVFTMSQYREWLKEAGFKKITTIEIPAPSPLILATK